MKDKIYHYLKEIEVIILEDGRRVIEEQQFLLFLDHIDRFIDHKNYLQIKNNQSSAIKSKYSK